MNGLRLLIDANLSPRLAIALRERGIEARHVVEIGLGAADLSLRSLGIFGADLAATEAASH